jgi:cell division protein FtsQ
VIHRPWLWVLLGLLTLAVIAGTLRFAPFFSVEKITVTGNHQVTSDAVLAAASVPTGTQVLTAPLDQIAGRVESLDAVAEANVRRDWPNGLKIVVRERRPVGYVMFDGGVGLIGSDGSVYRQESKPPPDLPRLPDAAVGGVGDPYESRLSAADAHAFDVATTIPRELQKRLSSIATTNDASVVLKTDDGVLVHWGSAESGKSKAHVVLLLMRRPGWGSQITEADVSAPAAPALD